MKHFLYIISIISALSAVSFEGCKGEKTEQQEENDSDSTTIIIEESTLPQFSEARGIIGDGSTMNYIELTTEQGDTMNIRTSGSFVGGGIMEGDEAYVAYCYNDEMEDKLAAVIINISTLSATWTQKGLDGSDQKLQILSDGTINTQGMNTEFKKWKISDGALLMTSYVHSKEHGQLEKTDTFKISTLTEDSLVLSNRKYATAFSRER
jgi:hypothetical protein